MLSLLKTFFNRSFLALFCTQYLGAFNDNFFRTAMATFITYKVKVRKNLRCYYYKPDIFI